MRPTGITWDFRRASLRRLVVGLTLAGVAGLSVPLAAADSSSSQVGQDANEGSRVQDPREATGFTPVWADPLLGTEGKGDTSQPAVTPLPTLAEAEQVIGAQRAWASGATGKGVDVAVIDTGVTPVAGLNAPDKLVYGPDLSFDSQDAATAHVDGYGHGTAMAGIIAGDDAAGFKGVAPDARVLSVRVGATNGAVDASQIIAAIDWVVQHRNTDGLNVRVINLSLGTNGAQDYQLDPLAHAAEVAWRHGIVVVAAVGNDGTAATTVATPATDPYLLAVSAEDPNGTIDSGDDTIPTFANHGTARRHADVVAPGTSIVSLRAPGSTLDTAFPGARVGERFFRGSGTSQAAAMVSGAAALLLSQRPDLTPDQVKSMLMSTARSIRAGSNTLYAGAGLISIPDALAKKTPKAEAALQWFPTSSGQGSLESSRGSLHVAFGDETLTGERDIFGLPYDAKAHAQLAEAENAWSGATWSGATWSGATWSGATWSGSNWS